MTGLEVSGVNLRIEDVLTEEAREDFEKFATRFEKDPALSRIIKIGLYEIENQLNLITKNQQILHQKLEKYSKNR